MVGLEGLAHPPPRHQLGTEEEFAARYLFLQSAQDRSTFLKFAGKVMLYQPAALLPRVMPAASQNPAEVKPPTPVLPLFDRLPSLRSCSYMSFCQSLHPLVSVHTVRMVSATRLSRQHIMLCAESYSDLISRQADMH